MACCDNASRSAPPIRGIVTIVRECAHWLIETQENSGTTERFLLLFEKTRFAHNDCRFSESGETSRLPPGSRQHFYARRFHRRSETHLGSQSGLPLFKPRLSGTPSGPQIDATKALNVGVAAHITSAAEGGPRHNPLLSPEERRHPDNGIWLCQNCAKLIDNDTSRYTEKLIRAWREIAEDHALSLIGKTDKGKQSSRGIGITAKTSRGLSLDW